MSTLLPGNHESAALALDGGMDGLLRRRKMMGGIGDPTSKKIIALLHFDGDFTDVRGHTVNTNNTYNTTWIDGVFGRACNKPSSAGFNVNIHNLQAQIPTTFTAMWYMYNSSCNIGLCGRRSYARPDNNCGLIISVTNSPYLWKNGNYNTRVAFTKTRTIAISGGWHHYALAYNNGYIACFQDGEKYADFTINTTDDISYLGDAFYISGLSNNGAVDEFAYSDKLLFTGNTYNIPTSPFK